MEKSNYTEENHLLAKRQSRKGRKVRIKERKQEGRWKKYRKQIRLNRG